MLRVTIDRDDFDRKQKHYFLTQGDSCTIYAKPYKDGAALPIEKVEKCVFKLSNQDYQEEFSKELFVENDKFVLRLGTDETSLFSIGQHYYEIEYTLLGGEVQTPNQWIFEILNQIRQ